MYSFHLWDAQPVIGLLHGLTSVIHWFGLIPLVPVRTQTCRKKRRLAGFNTTNNSAVTHYLRSSNRKYMAKKKLLLWMMKHACYWAL